MVTRVIAHLRRPLLIIAVVPCLAAGVYAQSGNIHSTEKWAWETNIGWINFLPAHGGVAIDPITGSFTGYAWGENVGWISFKGSGAIAYNVVATTVIAVTRGDVNGDGTIDLLDVRLCLQIATGYLDGTPAQRQAADVDSDGDVDETDVQILSDYVLGKRSALP